MNQREAPLFEALLAHVNQARGNFHVPGHKQGQAFDFEGKKWFETILQVDLTEVGELDDLHHPQGVILEAQRLAAEAFRASYTFFLVGGTTAGNLAVILTLCRPGDSIIIQRNCHQSVFHGCMLAGAEPICLPVRLDEGGLEQPIDPEDLKRLLREHASVQGVIITSPTYFGVVQPVGEIAAICREHGIPLIVDEAHGAHFGFHPYLPPSAMDVGADVAIQSTHKMLTSMTMSSMLHLKGEKVDVQEVAHWLRVIESSSPSYPLMASLDLARRWIAINGKEELEKLLARLNHFRGNIEYLRRIQEIAFPEQDPLKFSLCAANGVAGFALADWLEREGIYPELADHQKVLFVFSIGTSERDLDTLAGVLRKLDEEVLTMPAQSTLSVPVGVMQGQPEVSLREIRLRKKRNVPLQEAVDQISTEMIIPYPPGIPLVLPGERFREEVVHFLFEVLKWGGKVRGVGMFTTPMVNVLI